MWKFCGNGDSATTPTTRRRKQPRCIPLNSLVTSWVAVPVELAFERKGIHLEGE